MSRTALLSSLISSRGGDTLHICVTCGAAGEQLQVKDAPLTSDPSYPPIGPISASVAMF